MSVDKDTKEIEKIVEEQARNESPASAEKDGENNEANLDKRMNKAMGSKKWIFS